MSDEFDFLSVTLVSTMRNKGLEKKRGVFRFVTRDEAREPVVMSEVYEVEIPYGQDYRSNEAIATALQTAKETYRDWRDKDAFPTQSTELEPNDTNEHS